MNGKIKILQVTAVETTVRYLLYPLLNRLSQEGYEVHVACSPTSSSSELQRSTFKTWPMPIARRILTWSHGKALWQLYRLMRTERFDVVHVHTPIAAVLGRIAAKLAGIKYVVYTAHGFYFHERMKPWVRRPIIWVEKILGRFFTDYLLCQSQEDVETAVRERIMPKDRVYWIGNGVEVARFAEAPINDALRLALGFNAQDKIIGFIGRTVREKGIEELFRALTLVRREIPHARLLIVGDTLMSDRDRKAKNEIAELIRKLDLKTAVIFAGLRDDVPDLLKLMDVFTLPSYREGMPRSIIEAMASGLPVVATDIRGCREEVVDGQTGYLVPVGDVERLADTFLKLLSDEDKAHRMGERGQKRAVEAFDESLVLTRQLNIYREFLSLSE